MTADVLADITIETVGWDHGDAVRLRAGQQQEIDQRYADLEPSAGTGPGAEPRPPGPDPRDQVDPSNVFATLLLRVDGEPAGHAALRDLSGRGDYQGGRHPEGTAEVKRVYVAPGHRGRGLSRTLMSAVEDVARAAGVRHLILETGLMQPESLGLYLRMGYDPVESFGVFSDEPGSRCFGKWLAPEPGSAAPEPEPPAPETGPAAQSEAEAPEIRAVPWNDPGAAALRRAMGAFHQARAPERVRNVEARGGHDVVDAVRGRSALVRFLATVDGRPAGCATLIAAHVGPEHLAADPLQGVLGLPAIGASGGVPVPSGFEMRTVFVEPAVRRAGVASALVRQIEAEARRRGGRALYLGTGRRQPEALRLYVKLGYRPVLPFPPHDDPQDPLLLLLGKPL